MAFSYRPPADDGFGETLLKVLATSLASSLAQQGVSQGLGYAVDQAKAPDPVAVANTKNVMDKMSVAAEGLKDLPAMDRADLLIKNWGNPEAIFQSTPDTSGDRGRLLPKDKAPPPRTNADSPFFHGPPTPEEANRQFYWQAKSGQNQLTNRADRPKMYDSTDGPSGGRYKPLSIKTGSPLEQYAQENPETYDWAKKGKGMQEQQIKTLIEQMRGDSRMKVAEANIGGRKEVKQMGIDLDRDKLAQQQGQFDEKMKAVWAKVDLMKKDPKYAANSAQLDALMKLAPLFVNASTEPRKFLLKPGLENVAQDWAQQLMDVSAAVDAGREPKAVVPGGGGSSGGAGQPTFKTLDAAKQYLFPRRKNKEKIKTWQEIPDELAKQFVE